MWSLVRCQRTLGSWPARYEYAEWRRLQLRVARTTGRDPPPKALDKLFGSYDRFVKPPHAGTRKKTGCWSGGELKRRADPSSLWQR